MLCYFDRADLQMVYTNSTISSGKKMLKCLNTSWEISIALALIQPLVALSLVPQAPQTPKVSYDAASER